MKRKIVLLFLTALFIHSGYCQIIPGISYYNNLQYNAAYAGQDGKNRVLLGGLLASGGYSNDYKSFQTGYSTEVDKIKSGMGLFLSYTTEGGDKLYTIGGIYNYHFKINEHSDFRAGLRLNVATLKEKWYYFYFDPERTHTETSLLFDPAFWYRYKGLNIGLSVQNVTANSNYTRDIYFTLYHDSIKGANVTFIPVLNFSAYNYRQNDIYELNPQLNFEILQSVIISIGGSHVFTSFHSDNNINVGIGFKLPVNSTFIFSYTHIDSETQFFSVFLKLGFK